MSIIKIGNTLLGQGGVKGDMPSFTINGTTVTDGTSLTISGEGGVNTIAITNLSELQSGTTNKIWSIQGDIDLGTTTLNIPSGVTLKFEGGSIINGTLNSTNNDTYIWSEELVQIFDITTDFTGKFNFRACYPEWFGAKGDGATENINFFGKTTEFVDVCGGGVIELWGEVYNFSSFHQDGAWNTTYTGDGFEAMIYIGSNTHLISKVNSKIKVIEHGLDVFNLNPITAVDIPSSIITITSASGLDISPQIGYAFYVDGVFLGNLANKVDNLIFTLDSFAFTPTVGQDVTIVREANYKVVKFQSSQNSSMTGVHLEGNRELTGNGEGPHGILLHKNCNNVTIDNNEISGMPSDAVKSQFDSAYESGVKELYEDGGINSTTGLSDDSKIGSQVRSVVSYNLARARIITLDKFMMFDTYSYQQWNAVPRGIIHVYYYQTGDIFLGARLNQNMYEYLPILKDGSGVNADYVKIVIDATDSNRFDYTATGGETTIELDRIAPGGSINNYIWINSTTFADGEALLEGTDFTFTDNGIVSTVNFTSITLSPGDEVVVSYNRYRIDARAVEVPTNINIINNDFHDCGRQGISITGFQDLLIHNNIFHEIYGSPGAAIDLEDGELLNRRVEINGNKFWNNKLGITLYATVEINIVNNRFLRATDEFDGKTGQTSHAISQSHPGYGAVHVKNNYFENAIVTVGESMVLESNTFEFTSINVKGGDVKNNIFNASSLSTEAGTTYDYSKFNIIGNTFLGRDLLGDAEFFQDADLPDEQIPSYFLNNSFSGSGGATFREGVIVDDINFFNTTNIRIESTTVNNLKTNSPLTVWLEAKDYYFKGWELNNAELTVRNSGVGSNMILRNFIWNYDSSVTTPNKVFDKWGGDPLDSLRIINCELNDYSTGGVGHMDTIGDTDNLYFIGNSIRSNNAMNLFPSTPTALNPYHIFNNEFKNVTLNTKVGDVLQNNLEY